MRVSPVGETGYSNEALRGPSGAGGTPEAFGAGIGRGLSSLGGTVSAVGEYLQQKNEEGQRFYAQQQLTKFQQELSDDLTARGRVYDPSGKTNFTKDTADIFAKKKDAFLAGLPVNLQPEYAARADAVGLPLHQQAQKFQLDAVDDYSRNSLTDAYTQGRIALDQDGSAANLDAQRLKLDSLISASGLSTAEQQALRRQYYTGMEITSYKSEVRNEKANFDALGVGSSSQAASLSLIGDLTQETPANVKAIAAAAEETIVKDVNPLIWAAQSDPTKAALLALVAYKRELPPEVKAALESGDAGKLAKAVEDVGGDAGKRAAAVIRGDELLPVSKIDADPRYANIPYEDRLAARKDAETEAANDATKAAQFQKAQHNQITNALFVGLSDGSAGQEDIDSLKQAGVLSDIDDINKAQETLKKYQGNVGLAAQGQTMLANGVTFNPADDDHKKIENALVGQQGLTAIDKMDSKYAANTLVPMIRQMKDIPTDVAGLLTGMVRNADSQKALWAYDLLTQIQQATPQGYDARVSSGLAKDVEFYRNAKDFYPQDRLIDMLKGGDTQEERVRNDTLRAKAKQLLSTDTTASQINQGVQDSLVNLGWFNKAGTQTGGFAVNNFQSDYEELFTDAYARYGDVNLAKNAATELVKKEWGVSAIGGQPTLMKFPPDKVGYTPINGNFDWITRQVRADLKLPETSTFQLVSDDQTEKEYAAWQKGEGPAPSYMVVLKGQDGVIRAWTPDANGVNESRRVWFDPKLAIMDQTQEWYTKRMLQQGKDAQQILDEAVAHQQATGHPIPQDVLHDNMHLLETQVMAGGGGGF